MKLKLEKDKYENDSKTYNELQEESENKFNTNINKYIAEYEKVKNELINTEKNKDMQIQNLEKLCKNLEEENFEIKQEMQILKNGVKERKMFLEETEQNYEKVKYELNRVKEDKLLNENENNRIKNEKARDFYKN